MRTRDCDHEDASSLVGSADQTNGRHPWTTSRHHFTRGSYLKDLCAVEKFRARKESLPMSATLSASTNPPMRGTFAPCQTRRFALEQSESAYGGRQNRRCWVPSSKKIVRREAFAADFTDPHLEADLLIIIPDWPRLAVVAATTARKARRSR